MSIANAAFSKCNLGSSFYTNSIVSRNNKCNLKKINYLQKSKCCLNKNLCKCSIKTSNIKTYNCNNTISTDQTCNLIPAFTCNNGVYYCDSCSTTLPIDVNSSVLTTDPFYFSYTINPTLNCSSQKNQ